jgi:fluoroquinolone transport system permease protein
MVVPVRAAVLPTVRALVAPTVRAVPWTPFAVAVGVAFLVAGGGSVLIEPLLRPDAVALLRAAAVCGALGAAFLLDDPAARSTRVVPVSRAVRLGTRVAVVAPALALWWGAVVALIRANVETQVRLPLGALTVEAAALVCAALAVAAVVVRGADSGRAGAVAAPALVFAVVAAYRLPQDWALIVPADDARWAAAHTRWGALLTLAVVTVGSAALIPTSIMQLWRPKRPVSRR